MALLFISDYRFSIFSKKKFQKGLVFCKPFIFEKRNNARETFCGCLISINIDFLLNYLLI